VAGHCHECHSIEKHGQGNHLAIAEALGRYCPGMLIVLIAVLSYLPAFPAGFVFDDHSLITSNGLLRGPLWKVWFNATATDYWPLTWTSFWLEWRLWVRMQRGITFSMCFSTLPWPCCCAGAASAPGARGLARGLLFAVHPVGVESVAWISERKNTLSGVFYLSAVLVWVSGGEALTFRRRLLSLGLFAAALLAKVSVVMLPPVLLLIALFRRGRLVLRDWVQTAPFFAWGSSRDLSTSGSSGRTPWADRGQLLAHGGAHRRRRLGADLVS